MNITALYVNRNLFAFLALNAFPANSVTKVAQTGIFVFHSIFTAWKHLLVKNVPYNWMLNASQLIPSVITYSRFSQNVQKQILVFLLN